MMLQQIMSLEAAAASVAEVEADIRDLEARAGEIGRQCGVAATERDEAAAAVARAIVDAVPSKQRDSLSAAQLKTEAACRALDLARDELAARLDRARDRLDAARRDLLAARERDGYARSAAALSTFAEQFTAALGALADVDPRHRGDVADRIRAAVSGPLTTDKVAAHLGEWIQHYRRRAGLETAPTAASIASGPPLANDTGAFVKAELTFTQPNGDEHTVPPMWVGNLPSDVVKRAVAQGAAEQIGARPGFRSVIVLETADVPNEDGELIAFHPGQQSIPASVAERLIASGAAKTSAAIDDRDIEWHRAQRPTSIFSTSTMKGNKFLPPVQLGRLEPKTMEAA